MGQEMRLRLLPEALRALRVSAATPTSFIFLFALWAERERRRSDRYANGHAISELIDRPREWTFNFFKFLFVPRLSIENLLRLPNRSTVFTVSKGERYFFISTSSFVDSFTAYFDRFQAILHLHTSLAYGQFLQEDSKFPLFSPVDYTRRILATSATNTYRMFL